MLVPPPCKYVEGTDDVWTVARESLKNLQGILIHGGPGNGKSYMVDTLLKEVPEDIPVHRMSRTHVTARTIKGDTTSHWLNRHSKGNLMTPCVVFVDELWLHEYNLLARLHAFSLLPDVCFICTGDDLQLESIGNLHGATELSFEALGKSDMLKLMCPTQIELVENKRSDPVIHAFVTKCRTKRKADVIDEGRATFKFDGEADTHLVLSNAKRRRINIDRNEATRPPDARLLEANDSNIHLHVGLKLQGCNPVKSRGIANGILYEITSLDKETMTVKDEEGEYCVPYDFAKKAFRLAIARTIFSVQSQTLQGSVAIHDMDHPLTTEKHLLTAVSRATSYDKVRLE